MRGTQDHSSLFQEALEAGKRRDYPRAVDILTRIVGSADHFPQALLYLGRSYHALSEYEKAVQALNFYIREKPASAAGYFFLGRSYLALEDHQAAIRHLKRAVELDPRFPAAYGLLGLACLKTRRSDKAIWWFAKALELDPRNARLQVGYLNAALVLAIRLFYRGQLVDSARLFNEVLDQGRSGILAHLYLAAIYRELDRDSLALFHVDAASRMSPQDPFLHLQKALILLSLGQKKQALEELRVGTYFLNAAAPRDSSPEQILRYITINLFRERRFREAIFYASKLLKAAYHDPQLHALVAESYRSLGDLRKAKNHYQRALENDKETLEIRHGYFAVLWQQGDFAELLAESARLLQRHADDGPGLYYHSLAMSRTGAPLDQAIGELQRQVKARGPDPLLMAELGGAYARAGLPELAEGWFLRAMKMAKPDAETLLSLAGVYEALGRRDELRTTWSRYLELRPDDGMTRKRFVHHLLETESFADAAGEIARLLTMEPGNAKLKEALAFCHRRAGRHAEALVILKDLLRDSPDSEELVKAAVYSLDKMGARKVAITVLTSFIRRHKESLSLLLMTGVLQYQEGEVEKSAATFRKAVSLSPLDWRANRNLGMVYRRMGNTEFAEKFLAKAAEQRRAAEKTRA